MTDTEAEKTVTLISPNGMRVTVAESKKAARLGAGYRLPGKAKKASAPGGASTQSQPDKGWADRTVADLKAEIEKRNVDRDDASKIPAEGNKPDLVAALEADDKARADNTPPAN